MNLRNYSSGMAVRLGFAVACHADANVFLVDEVFRWGTPLSATSARTASSGCGWRVGP